MYLKASLVLTHATGRGDVRTFGLSLESFTIVSVGVIEDADSIL